MNIATFFFHPFFISDLHPKPNPSVDMLLSYPICGGVDRVTSTNDVTRLIAVQIGKQFCKMLAII